jgi:hypothetical protein
MSAEPAFSGIVPSRFSSGDVMTEMVTGYQYLPDNQLKLKIRPCPSCGLPHELVVGAIAFENWADGHLPLERAFPGKTPAELELLLTGIDSKCWNTHIREEDEGDAELQLRH